MINNIFSIAIVSSATCTFFFRFLLVERGESESLLTTVLSHRPLSTKYSVLRILDFIFVGRPIRYCKLKHNVIFN